MKCKFLYQLSVACVLLLSANMALWGQGATATATGSVTDPTGAILPGAHVIITNTATNVKHDTVTNGSGQYTVPLLPPGTYQVDVESQGFRAVVQSGIILQVDQTARLNFKLQPGQVSQTVQVTGEAQQIQTQTASTGVVVANKQIIEIPLNGRQYYSLAYLTPGTYPPAQNSTLSFRGGFNVAGSSEVSNNYSFDGFDNIDPATNSPAFLPSIDDIQEFKLLTGVYSAQYGQYSGGQLLAVSKSGTNAIHGTAFDYLRNQVFDAENYFNGNQKKPTFVRNEFGGTVGGPLIKNKAFAFVSYEGLRLHQTVSALATVPTTAMRSGDFSAFLPAGAKNHVLLVNPITHAPISGNVITTANGLNPIGAALASFYPAPTQPTASGSLPSNNYNFNENRIENMNEYAVRGDYTLNSSNSIYMTYGHQADPSFEPSNTLCSARVIPGFGCNVGATGQIAGFSYTHIFSPALVNQILISWNQFNQPRVQEDVTNNFVANNNIPGVFLGGNLANNTGVPSTAVTGFSTIGGATNLPQNRTDDNYEASDAVTYTHGPHTFTLGAEYVRFAYSLYYVADGRGAFNFTGSASAPTSGNTFADLLFGTPTSTVRNPYAPTDHPRQMSIDGYVQDDWKATSHLTVNLGVRYEYNSPVYEKDNRDSSFDPATNTMRVAGQPRAFNPTPTVPLTFAGGKNLYNTQTFNFAPRVGFSMQMPNDPNTVLRGGAGYFYNNEAAGNGLLGLLFNAPIRDPQTFNASNATPILLTNPYPNTINGATTSAPTGIIRNWRTPLITEWSLGVQRQITPTLLGDITYFGTKGTYLPLNYNNNQPPPTTLPTAQVNALRPFQGFGNVTYINTAGVSSYQSLQAKLEKRYSNGFLFGAAYTWGHSIDNGGGIGTGSSASSSTPQDYRNLRAERGSSDFNIDDHFTFSPVWELPFGKGRKWLQTGVPNLIAGGWQVTGILTLQSGSPITAIYTANNSNTLNSEDRPNQVGNPNNGPKTTQEWFNTSAFVNPGFGHFGDARRNSITGPPYKNVDFSASRFFPVISNRVNAEFRAELFNAFNHPNFYLPNANPNSPAFGSISQANAAREIEFALRFTF